MNRAAILAECRRMKVGQRLELREFDLQNAFPSNPYAEREQGSANDRLLECLVGSMFGTYRIRSNRPERPTVTISRHEESDDIYWVEPGRQWMFERQPNGTLKRISGRD